MKPINVNAFIETIGGRKSLIIDTGLSRARISQWTIENHIPKAWVKFLKLKYPKQCKEHGITD